MTTTELINLLKSFEYGAITGKPRKISLTINGRYFISDPEISINSTGDGIAGAEINLDLTGEVIDAADCIRG